MRVFVYLEKSAVRGGIEVFAERHVAELRAEGHEVEVVDDLRRETGGATNSSHASRLASHAFENSLFSDFDEVVVHKCSDVKTLEAFPPEKTVYYVHDHAPICPRTYAYTPLKHNCSRPGGVWPCIFCAPLCRSWKAALGRVFSQRRRIAAMARFRKVVVISEFMKSRLVANGIDAAKIEVRPPEVNKLLSPLGDSEFRRSGETHELSPRLLNSQTPSSESNQISVEKIDLLYVGQLIRGKGVHLLLEAMSRMKTKRTLDIVGTGNMEEELKSIAARLGLADRVRFNGFQNDPQEWMRRAACVVVTSFWQEPYGLVAAEAVALGRPVVAFAVGGLPEACGGKATLVPPGDVAALAAALEV